MSSLFDLRLHWQHFTHKLRQKHNVASYHNCFIFFNLIVEDHRLWFVGIQLHIFDASLICRRWDRLRGQSCDNLSASWSLPSITEVWPSVVYFEYFRFLLYRTEPPVKVWSSRLWCDFIAVPLILGVLFFSTVSKSLLDLLHFWVNLS